MKICLIGETGTPNEGMKNILHNFNVLLSKNHDVLMLSGWEAFKIKFWRELLKFKPEVVHYVSGLSLKTLILTKLIKLFFKCRVIISAVHPQRSSFLFISRFFKPDLILVQTKETERKFKNLGFKTKFLTNGVNIEKFTPVSKQEKEKLREKYNIDKKKWLIFKLE